MDELVTHTNNIRDYTTIAGGNNKLNNTWIRCVHPCNNWPKILYIGTLRFKEEGIYSFPCASHTVYYILQKDCIVILAILHQSMTPEIHLNR